MRILNRTTISRFAISALVASMTLLACAGPTIEDIAPSGSSALHVRELASPAPEGSSLPRLTPGPRGGLSLSWIEESETESGVTARWRFATWEGDAFSSPREIAEGQDWFVNWVDLPALQWLGGTRWVGHYLQRASSGAYDYHVRVVRSADGGASWSPSVRLHEHEGPGEHGFVSWTDLGDGRALAAWLDGRGVHGDAGEIGATALYARIVGGDGELGPEIRLDDRVCDCCSTAAVALDDGGVLVAYRDRGSEELRDIALVRWRDGEEPRVVWKSGDGWTIAGCPVNGPALAADGGLVGVAWFTMGADAQARVLAVLSTDGGRSFGAPRLLARGPVQGRVDAAIDSGGLLVVTWLETTSEESAWKVARLDPRRDVAAAEVVIATHSSREAGVARVARSGEALLFAHTDGLDPPRVAVHELRWD